MSFFSKLFASGKKDLEAQLADAKKAAAKAEADAKVQLATAKLTAQNALADGRKDLAAAVQASEPAVKTAVDAAVTALESKILSSLA